MPLITDANKKLKILGIDGTISKSSRPNKKLMLKTNKKTVHFGSATSKTYLEGASKEKRDAYKARHDKIYLKSGQKARTVKYSPAYLSWEILWN